MKKGMNRQRLNSAVKRDRVFLRLPQVLEIIPVSKSTWWSGIREGRFPKPVKLSERTSAWLQADIDDLCDLLAGTATPQGQGDKEARRIDSNE